MKLSQTLQALHKGPLIKRLWKNRGTCKIPEFVVPAVLQDKNVTIVDPTQQPELPRWEPPVKEDLAWTGHPVKNELENYHEEPILICYQKCRLLEGIKQVQILTKSQYFEGLPPSVEKLVGKVEIPNQDLLVQRYIMQSQKWHTDQNKLAKRIDKEKIGFKFRPQYGIYSFKSAKILCQNMLRLCQSQTGLYPSILKERTLIREPFIRSTFSHDDRTIQVLGTNDFLLMSKSSLPKFAQNDIVDASTNFSLPNIHPLKPTIDLESTNNYNLEPFNCLKNQNVSLHPHTLFLINQQYWKTPERTANALLYLFAYAINEARRKFGEGVTILPEPINIQCVHMDFNNLNFLALQLNTLNFQTHNGIKNLIWCDENNIMFKKILSKPWLGEELNDTKYVDYNPKVFQKFLAFYVNGHEPQG